MTTAEPREASFLFDDLLGRWTALRDAAPVHHDAEQNVWQVRDHRNVSAVLADPATFSSDFSGLTPTQSDFDTFRQGNFVGMDPPEHRKLRALVSQAFTPRVVAELAPRIRAISAELLDSVDGRDSFDLVDTLAYPLPIIVIAELLGVPVDDRGLFQDWAATLFGGEQLGETLDMADIERALEAIAPTVREMNDYILDHIRHHRRHPSDGLTSKLVRAEVDGARMEDQEIVGFVALLLVAGHITTTALLGSAVHCFDRYPRAGALVRAEPGRLPDAIEEVLRWLPPFPELGRRTTREVRLGDLTVPADSIVMANLGCANRDPARFADPDSFDVTRSPNPHLTFGHGIHFCFGAPLARLEGRIALGLLHERYSEIRVGPRESVAFQNPAVIVSARHLPIEVRRS